MATPRDLRTVWVVLVALHSYAVAVLLVFAPGFTLSLGGFAAPEDLFFVRQGGVFHAVVATAYLVERRRFGSMDLLLFAKTAATAFLVVAWLLLDAAPLVALAALGDGLMAAVTAGLRPPLPRPRLRTAEMRGSPER